MRFTPIILFYDLLFDNMHFACGGVIQTSWAESLDQSVFVVRISRECNHQPVAVASAESFVGQHYQRPWREGLC